MIKSIRPFFVLLTFVFLNQALVEAASNCVESFLVLPRQDVLKLKQMGFNSEDITLISRLLESRSGLKIDRIRGILYGEALEFVDDFDYFLPPPISKKLFETVNLIKPGEPVRGGKVTRVVADFHGHLRTFKVAEYNYDFDGSTGINAIAISDSYGPLVSYKFNHMGSNRLQVSNLHFAKRAQGTPVEAVLLRQLLERYPVPTQVEFLISDTELKISVDGKTQSDRLKKVEQHWTELSKAVGLKFIGIRRLKANVNSLENGDHYNYHIIMDRPPATVLRPTQPEIGYTSHIAI